MLEFHTISLICICLICLFSNIDGNSLTNNSILKTRDFNGTYLDKTKTSLYYMNTFCDRPVNLLKLKDRNAIRIAPWNTSYPSSFTKCIMVVDSFAYQNFRLVLTFKKVKMSSAESTGKCLKSKLDLFSGDTTSPLHQLTGDGGICGDSAKQKEYTTQSNIMLLRYCTQNLKEHPYQFFEAVITPFHSGKCQNDEFLCKNKRCIMKQLTCDGYDNCGDASDEEACSKLSGSLSIPAIIGLTVGSAAAVIVAVIISIILCRFCCGKCSYQRLD